MSTQVEILKKKFGSSIRLDEQLSKYSWFNLGGPAEIFFKANNLSELILFLKEIKKNQYKKITLLGAGSNTLIRDGGIEGSVIKLGSAFSFVKLLEQDIIHVGAATLDKVVSNFATEKSLGNMEFLSCIPGSIGGAIIMNSGCYQNDISKILLSIEIINREGITQEISADKIKFLYRGCNLEKDLIIISAKLKGLKSDRKEVEEKQANLIKRKKESQPSQVKTCGSTFKNTENKKAWLLIKESGCEFMSVGKAKVSEKHCNFFINEGNASSFDIEELINKVRKKVLEKTGVTMELEINVIGSNK